MLKDSESGFCAQRLYKARTSLFIYIRIIYLHLQLNCPLNHRMCQMLYPAVMSIKRKKNSQRKRYRVCFFCSINTHSSFHIPTMKEKNQNDKNNKEICGHFYGQVMSWSECSYKYLNLYLALRDLF